MLLENTHTHTHPGGVSVDVWLNELLEELADQHHIFQPWVLVGGHDNLWEGGGGGGGGGKP